MHRTGPLILPSWQAKGKTGWAARSFGNARGTMLLATGSVTPAKTIGIVRVSRWRAAVAGVESVAMIVGLQADQLLRGQPYPIDVPAGPTKVDGHVAANGPTQARKRLRERQSINLFISR